MLIIDKACVLEHGCQSGLFDFLSKFSGIGNDGSAAWLKCMFLGRIIPWPARVKGQWNLPSTNLFNFAPELNHNMGHIFIDFFGFTVAHFSHSTYTIKWYLFPISNSYHRLPICVGKMLILHLWRIIMSKWWKNDERCHNQKFYTMK